MLPSLASLSCRTGAPQENQQAIEGDMPPPARLLGLDYWVNVLSVGSNMRHLLDAGLGRTLIQRVAESDGATPDDFLAAADTLLTREKVSPANAAALWTEAANHFFGAPAGAVRTRRGFVVLMLAATATLPTAWVEGIPPHPLPAWADGRRERPFREVAEELDKVMSMLQSGERFFWAYIASLPLTLLWAASLKAVTERGAGLRTALRRALAKAFEQLGITNTGARDVSESLYASVYTDEYDMYLADIVRKLGHANIPGFVAPTFEEAADDAVSGARWKAFVYARLMEGPTELRLDIRMCDW